MLPPSFTAHHASITIYSRGTLTLTRSIVPRRAIIHSVSGSVTKNRHYCYWRKRRNHDAYTARLESRLRKDGLGGAHTGRSHSAIDEYVPRLYEDKVYGVRGYRDHTKAKYEEQDGWRDLRRRRLAIWKRMFDEDPYNAMFGPSNSALNGKGWAHPLWNQIPKWMQEEFGIRQSAIQQGEFGSKSNTVKTPNSVQDKPTTDAQPVTHHADLEAQPRPIEVPRMKKAPESSYVYTYDPISGRMISKEASTQAPAEPREATSTTGSVETPVKPYRSNHRKTQPGIISVGEQQHTNMSPPEPPKKSHVHSSAGTSTSLYSNAHNLVEEPLKNAKELQPAHSDNDLTNRPSTGMSSSKLPRKSQPASSASSKLSTLPPDDVDFLNLEDIRSRIAYMRKRIESTQEQSSRQTADLEKEFEQLHKKKSEESIQKPDVKQISKAEEVHGVEREVGAPNVYSSKKLQGNEAPDKSPRLTTVLERLRGQTAGQSDNFTATNNAVLPRSMVEPPLYPEIALRHIASEVCQQVLKQTRQVDQAMDDIASRISKIDLSKTRELSELDRQREELLRLVGGLEVYLKSRREATDNLKMIRVHILRIRSVNNLPSKVTHDFEDASNMLKHLGDDTAVVQEAITRLGRLRSRIDEKFKRTRPDNNLEAYDIHMMARSVLFEPEPENAPFKKVVASPKQTKNAHAGFSDDFDANLARRLKNYEIQGLYTKKFETQTQRSSSAEQGAPVSQSRLADEKLRRVLDKYEQKQQVPVKQDVRLDEKLTRALDKYDQNQALPYGFRTGQDNLVSELKEQQDRTVVPEVGGRMTIAASNSINSVSAAAVAEGISPSAAPATNVDGETSGNELTDALIKRFSNDHDSLKSGAISDKSAPVIPKVRIGAMRLAYRQDGRQMRRKESKMINTTMKETRGHAQPSDPLTEPTVDPQIYKILAFDRHTKSLVISESTYDIPNSPEPLSVTDALARVHNPSKYLPHLTSDYTIVSASKDLLVLRKHASTSSPADADITPEPAPEKSERPWKINPIDGTTIPLPQTPSGNFASPTGFVSFHQPSAPEGEDGRESETERREVKREIRSERRGREEMKGKGGGVSRVFVAGIAGATVCYVAGVVGELLK